jgi:hypothetical protein
MSAVASTGIAAAPAPCTSRAIISTVKDGASADTSAPSDIAPTPSTSGSRIPTMSAIRPYAGVPTASATV